MGATLIPGACKPGFELSAALDAELVATVMFTFIGMDFAIHLQLLSFQLCNVLLARILHRKIDHGYVMYYWHGFCIRKTGHFLSSRDFRSFNVLDTICKKALFVMVKK